jgi:hypothetical protein
MRPMGLMGLKIYIAPMISRLSIRAGAKAEARPLGRGRVPLPRETGGRLPLYLRTDKIDQLLGEERFPQHLLFLDHQRCTRI